MTDASPSNHPPPDWRRRWPDRLPYAAAAWSLAYGASGLFWTLGGAGYPFGAEADRGAHLSALGAFSRTAVAPWIAGLGLIGFLVALAMGRGPGGLPRRPLLAFGWAAAVGLAVVIPDFRLLVLVAYAPILLLGAPFGWPPNADVSSAIPWPVLNQLVCIVGGTLWAGATLAFQRRTRGACGHCGRTDSDSGWPPHVARRRGRRAVAVAVAIPAVYAASRWAWALGFPLGISEAFFREGQAAGLWWIGAALATLALVGSLLTFGLIRAWGEAFPRWLPVVGGRTVPPPLVLVPTAVVALIATSAGLMFVRFAVTGTFRLGEHPVTLRENAAALVPELLWPLWGVSLGIAGLAYYYRTRGRCDFCGRGRRR